MTKKDEVHREYETPDEGSEEWIEQIAKGFLPSPEEIEEYQRQEYQREAGFDEKFFYLREDIRTVQPYGQFLSQPATHLDRLLSPLSVEDRKKILNTAYNQILNVDLSLGNSRYSLFQFTAYYYCEAMYHAEEYIQSLVENRGTLYFDRWVAPARVKPSDLSEGERKAVSSTISGTNSFGLCSVLARSVFLPLSDSEMIGTLRRTIAHTFVTGEQASALVGAFAYVRKDLERFEATADVLIADARILPTVCLPDNVGDRREFTEDVRMLESTLKEVSKVGNQVIEQQSQVMLPDLVSVQFDLDDQPTSILVPITRNIVIARDMREAVAMAERDKSSLLQMSPRRFEEFMSYIFKELGFEVELTKCTRDGGADILCMKCLHGVPFRLAVEVKRYKENRPISVSLVRSFVGANVAFRANRLLYVTTSRYTAPAREYADTWASHILTLKQYEQVQEWCREVRSQPPILL